MISDDATANDEKEGVSDDVSSPPMLLDDEFEPVRTRSGRGIQKKTHYEPETGHTVRWNVAAVTNYYEALQQVIDKDELEAVLNVHAVFSEFAKVGAGLGGGFENTKEL